MNNNKTLSFGDYGFIQLTMPIRNHYTWSCSFYAMSLDKAVMFSYSEETEMVNIREFTTQIISTAFDRNHEKVKNDICLFFQRYINNSI